MLRALTFCFVLITLGWLTAPAFAEDADGATPQVFFKLVSSNNPSSYGDPVDFTAILPEGTAGTVTFKIDSATISTVPVSNGQANYRTSELPLGQHRITAVFSGEEEQKSFSAELTQTVHQADPTVVLYCNPNWSIFGEPIECEVTLPADASGTVTFLDDVRPLGRKAAGNGQVSFTAPRLGAGSHLLTASYSGDSNFLPSNGRQTQTILQADTNVGVSCYPAPAYYWETVTCTAEVAPFATGTITATDAGLVVAKIPLADGIAVWSGTALDVGYHHIGATYPGDANHRGNNASFNLNVIDPEQWIQ